MIKIAKTWSNDIAHTANFPFNSNISPSHRAVSYILLKKRCQHLSNKFEILWQVAQNSFSLLLSYFVVQYALIIVV